MVSRWIQPIVSKEWPIVALMGAIMYFVIAGFGMLDVTSVGWIYNQHDIAGAYTGWTFYRDAPWEARIASNPAYGMDFGGSILFSDAIPLMAILFKTLDPILPDTFQYFGIWVLISFVLQGVFAWMLMKKVSDNPTIRILGACFILLTPLYYYRLVSCTHMSLTAHWLVLGSIYLCLPPHVRRPWLWWGLLVAASAFVHAYLFCMVVTLWLADIARRVITDPRNFKGWIEPAGVGAAVGALAWATGAWSGPAGDLVGGFGYFKMNVLSFLDPNPWPLEEPGPRPPWSFIMPDIPGGGGDYEGFAYLGLGGLLLTGVALWALPRVASSFKLAQFVPYAPFALALVGMAIFAISSKVEFGSFGFWVGWPDPITYLGELFRATGRFVWPLYYFGVLAVLFVLARRLQARTFIMVVSAAAIVQAVDTFPGWHKESQYLRYAGEPYTTPLTSPFWELAAERYSGVRVIPHGNNARGYLDVAGMAQKQGMVTDAFYLSRVSASATEESHLRVEHGIATGEWPQDTLFVVFNSERGADVSRRLREATNQSQNFLAEVDGYLVLAPGWSGCDNCGAVALP